MIGNNLIASLKFRHVINTLNIRKICHFLLCIQTSELIQINANNIRHKGYDVARLAVKIITVICLHCNNHECALTYLKHLFSLQYTTYD